MASTPRHYVSTPREDPRMGISAVAVHLAASKTTTETPRPLGVGNDQRTVEERCVAVGEAWRPSQCRENRNVDLVDEANANTQQRDVQRPVDSSVPVLMHAWQEMQRLSQERSRGVHTQRRDPTDPAERKVKPSTKRLGEAGLTPRARARLRPILEGPGMPPSARGLSLLPEHQEDTGASRKQALSHGKPPLRPRFSRDATVALDRFRLLPSLSAAASECSDNDAQSDAHPSVYHLDSRAFIPVLAVVDLDGASQSGVRGELAVVGQAPVESRLSNAMMQGMQFQTEGRAHRRPSSVSPREKVAQAQRVRQPLPLSHVRLPSLRVDMEEERERDVDVVDSHPPVGDNRPSSSHVMFAEDSMERVDLYPYDWDFLPVGVDLPAQRLDERVEGRLKRDGPSFLIFDEDEDEEFTPRYGEGGNEAVALDSVSGSDRSTEEGRGEYILEEETKEEEEEGESEEETREVAAPRVIEDVLHIDGIIEAGPEGTWPQSEAKPSVSSISLPTVCFEDEVETAVPLASHVSVPTLEPEPLERAEDIVDGSSQASLPQPDSIGSDQTETVSRTLTRIMTMVSDIDEITATDVESDLSMGQHIPIQVIPSEKELEVEVASGQEHGAQWSSEISQTEKIQPEAKEVSPPIPNGLPAITLVRHRRRRASEPMPIVPRRLSDATAPQPSLFTRLKELGAMEESAASDEPALPPTRVSIVDLRPAGGLLGTVYPGAPPAANDVLLRGSGDPTLVDELDAGVELFAKSMRELNAKEAPGSHLFRSPQKVVAQRLLPITRKRSNSLRPQTMAVMSMRRLVRSATGQDQITDTSGSFDMEDVGQFDVEDLHDLAAADAWDNELLSEEEIAMMSHWAMQLKESVGFAWCLVEAKQIPLSACRGAVRAMQEFAEEFDTESSRAERNIHLLYHALGLIFIRGDMYDEAAVAFTDAAHAAPGPAAAFYSYLGRSRAHLARAELLRRGCGRFTHPSASESPPGEHVDEAVMRAGMAYADASRALELFEKDEIAIGVSRKVIAEVLLTRGRAALLALHHPLAARHDLAKAVREAWSECSHSGPVMFESALSKPYAVLVEEISANTLYLEAVFWRGMANELNGDLREARRDYGLHISGGGAVVGAWIQRGFISLNNDASPEAALADFEHACVLDRGSGAAHTGLGWVKARMGHYADALRELTLAIALAPRDARPLYLRGVLLRKAAPEIALRDLSAALLVDPDHADSFVQRGMIYAERHDLLFAKSDFEKALEKLRSTGKEDTNNNLRLNLAAILLRLRQTEEAADHAAAVFRISPKESRAMMILAEAFVQDGQWNEAARLYSKLLHSKGPYLTGQDAVVWVLRGWCLANMGEFVLAMRDMVAAGEAGYPLDAVLGLTLGQKSASNEDEEGAEIGEEDLWTSELLALFGAIKQRTGDVEGARASFARARALSKTAWATFRYASFLHHMGELDEATMEYALAASRDARGRQHVAGRAHLMRGLCRASLGVRDRGIADFTRALRIDRKLLDALLARAAAHASLGHDIQAVEDYTKALELVPHHVGALINRGYLFGRMAKLDSALGDFNLVLSLAPNSSTALFCRGIIYHEMAVWSHQPFGSGSQRLDPGSAADAIRDFSLCLGLDEDHMSARRNRAVLYLGLSRFSAAAADFRVLAQQAEKGRLPSTIDLKESPWKRKKGRGKVAAEPSHVSLNITLAVCLNAAGRVLEALSVLKRIIDTQPGIVRAYVLRGDILSDPQFHEKARERDKSSVEAGKQASQIALIPLLGHSPSGRCAYAAALRVDPRCVEARVGLARNVADSDQPRLSWRLFSGALEIGESVIETKRADQSTQADVLLEDWSRLKSAALSGRAVANAALGRMDAASADAEAAVTAGPNNADAHVTRGALYWLTGAHNLAIEEYRLAASLEPQCVPAYFNLGAAFMAKQRWGEAIQALNVVIKAAPEDVAARVNRAVARSMCGDLAEALQDLDEAEHRSPTIAAIFFNRAAVLKCLGRLDEADRDLTRAVDLQPGDAEAYAQRAGIRGAQMRHEDAMSDYSSALVLDPDVSLHGTQ